MTWSLSPELPVPHQRAGTWGYAVMEVRLEGCWALALELWALHSLLEKSVHWQAWIIPRPSNSAILLLLHVLKSRGDKKEILFYFKASFSQSWLTFLTENPRGLRKHHLGLNRRGICLECGNKIKRAVFAFKVQVTSLALKKGNFYRYLNSWFLCVLIFKENEEIVHFKFKKYDMNSNLMWISIRTRMKPSLW